MQIQECRHHQIAQRLGPTVPRDAPGNLQATAIVKAHDREVLPYSTD